MTPLNFGAVPGHAFSNVPVATFTDPGGAEPITGTNYLATINWDDGTPTSSGTITYANGVFTVAGSHTYTSNGTYSPQVSITHEALPAVTATGTAVVSSTVWVDDNWVDQTHPAHRLRRHRDPVPGRDRRSRYALIYGVNAFSTIQAGINADRPAARSTSCPVYAEQRRHRRSVRLLGDEADQNAGTRAARACRRKADPTVESIISAASAVASGPPDQGELPTT